MGWLGRVNGTVPSVHTRKKVFALTKVQSSQEGIVASKLNLKMYWISAEKRLQKGLILGVNVLLLWTYTVTEVF